MSSKVSFHGKQVIIRTNSLEWDDHDKILESVLFKEMLRKYIKKLREQKSDFLTIFPKESEEKQERMALLLLKKLDKNPREKVLKENPEFKSFFSDIYLIDQFVEEFYNYWRSFERYLVCYSASGNPEAKDIDERPYSTFNSTIEKLNHTVRSVYRTIRENITHEHPIIYRQVPAGCQVGIIATKKKINIPEDYKELKKVPAIRQVLIEPPLIIDPPMNKRKGVFKQVDSNPLEGLKIDSDEWLCFPAKVGELMIHLYFHDFYEGIGITTANLFELCDDEKLNEKPDGIYVFGVPRESLKKYAPDETVFYHDKKNDVMVGAIPLGEEFGYFGYVKKMILTLHNTIMINKGRMPVHGAMTRITLKDGSRANVVIMGDSGAGKSESLEAFRILAEDNLKNMVIIFDDMGTLSLDDGTIKAYGTETGAFVRLDDLQAGYAFGNIDRSIIHSPQKINARATIPITTLREITHGWPVDYFLYANNYSEVKDNKYISKFSDAKSAMAVFGEGKRKAKGTTTETGLVSTYYANPFGAVQLKEQHEVIANKFFNAMIDQGIFVGQINTQLALEGMESKGPQEAAKELFRMISKKK